MRQHCPHGEDKNFHTPKMAVTFSKKYFNPLYFILNDLLKDESIRTILVYGGKSSSKTLSIAQLLAKECLIKKSSSISFRKESTIIKTTLKKSFNLALETMYIYPAFEKLEFSFRCSSGAEIVMKGLDDPEKAKGIESYKYVYLDELNHFEQTEFEQFNLSLRGIKGQKIFGTWNPVDENSWVKTELVDKYNWVETEYKLPCEHSFVKRSEDGKVILIKTSYEDNYWIAGSPCGTYGYRDENLIAEYELLRTRNYNSYKVNVLGEWGKTEFGGEILKCWRSETHTGEYKYDDECAIYLSFDENVNPYFPCGIFQVGKDGKSPTMIDVITLKNPNNTIRHMGAELRRRLTQWQHKGRIFVTGDATSQKDDVKQEKGHDLFRLLMNEITDWKPTRLIGNSNPSVVLSTEFFNSILEIEQSGLKYRVDKSCRIAIADYENTKEDKNGKVDKKTVTDPITKVSYQPYGHIFDLSRYFLCTVFANEYANYQRGGTPTNFTLGRNVAKNSYK